MRREMLDTCHMLPSNPINATEQEIFLPTAKDNGNRPDFVSAVSGVLDGRRTAWSRDKRHDPDSIEAMGSAGPRSPREWWAAGGDVGLNSQGAGRRGLSNGRVSVPGGMEAVNEGWAGLPVPSAPACVGPVAVHVQQSDLFCTRSNFW